ncbi:protein TolA [Paracoccus sp. (in: a-proteobacteria)]|uniref:protein TolA n=1 Tax=Paracoccus sp. TaxID=267 RepID=UPI0026E00416|nr:protein TolA [Paracoccus sp. (in: a-proteobacteria)]MDO5647894.1 protein TolA [Paracoccus sp. (in: a-proteobacteria)]
MRDRAERIGWWASGVVHTALILLVIFGGALFRAQPTPPVRSTSVSTISGAEFEAMAAAARGAGPIAADATAVASLPAPVADQAADAPSPATVPDAAPVVPLPAPEGAETPPDLRDFAPRPPVAVVTDLAPAQPPAMTDATPALPQADDAPQTETPAQPAPPRSPLALDQSARPQSRPDGLVENRNRRLAEAEAQRIAEQQAEEQRQAEAARLEADRIAAERAAEAERAAAAERRAAEQRQAEAERIAAETARIEAERRESERRAAEAALAEAERQAAEQRAEEQRQAEAARIEAERIAAERAAEAERQAAEQRAEEQRQAEAARIEAARIEAERRAAQAEADRIAAEAAAQAEQDRQRALQDALRDAMQADGTGQTGSIGTGDRQRIEGGSGASVGMDPLADALGQALSGAIAPPPQPMQLAPSLPMGDPITAAERDGLRIAIERCWNRGALSADALNMSISVAFQLDPTGVPERNSLRMIDHSGGNDATAQQAFEVARRGILMCGQAGFDLPAAKYGRWRDVIVDFRPGGVEFR